jgi:hypothetical protein
MAKGTPYCYRFRVPANKVGGGGGQSRRAAAFSRAGLGTDAASSAGLLC